MAKKKQAAPSECERIVLVAEVLDRAMVEAFVGSSQAFVDRLRFLQNKLDVQFQRYSDDGGLTSQRRWNPPTYFNCSHFALQARKTHEAWYVARQLNTELAAFDGEKLLILVRLFDQMRTEELRNLEADAYKLIPQHYYQFTCEIDRMWLLLSLKTTKPQVSARKKRRGRPNADRDAVWYKWKHIDDMTDAEIRDRWDRENPGQPVPRDNAENGLGVVASAIRREEKRRMQGTD